MHSVGLEASRVVGSMMSSYEKKELKPSNPICLSKLWVIYTHQSTQLPISCVRTQATYVLWHQLHGVLSEELFLLQAPMSPLRQESPCYKMSS